MRLLEMFSRSGHGSQPFHEKGWEVVLFDKYFDQDIFSLETIEDVFELLGDFNGFMCYPVCTHFSVSGSQYWAAKDQDGRTEYAVRLVEKCLQLIELFKPTDPEYDGPKFWWMLENPIGRIRKEVLKRLGVDIGEPLIIQPWEYAGWNDLSKFELKRLDELRERGLDDKPNFTREEVDWVIHRTNAYQKKTCLYGNFNRSMEKRPVKPVRYGKQSSLIMFYGKNDENRSATPMGFSRAFYAAQTGYKAHGQYQLFN